MAKPSSSRTADQLKNMSLTNLLGIYVLAGIALAGLVGFFGVQPLIISAQETGRDIERTHSEIDNLEKLQDDTEELRENYEEIRGQRDRIISLLPENNREESFLALISDLADENGMLFTNYSPETLISAEEDNAYETYQVRVLVTGTNEAAQDFLEAVERGSRFTEIHSVNVESQMTSETQNNDPPLELIITMQTYYQPAGFQAGSADDNGQEGEGS